jgi:hypothetical protein
MAERKVLNPPVDAKGDYEREQARQYLANKRKRIEQNYDLADAKAHGGQANKNRVQKALKDDAVYASILEDEKKLASGQLSDDMTLRFARANVAQRQKKEDKSHETQEKINKSFETVREKGGTIDDVGQEMVNQGGSYTRVGPDGIVTSDKNYYEAWKKLIQGNFGAKATFNDGLDRGKYAEYGNNYFMLYTYYPGFEGFLTADGVMQEMPAISMSTEWENSPAASVGEELDKALNNEFLEFCAMKTTNANTPIMRRKDALTSRCYKDTGDISFQLKFRVYPGQKVGTQALTTAQEWLLLLSMTTPINAACSFSIDNAIGTVVKAADGIAAAFKAVKDGISGTNSKDKEKQQQQQAALVRAEATLGAEGATALKSFENADARITNPNVFGACLFGIRLYPWIFKKPLTCYISSWSVTPSKEWNEDQFVNDHYYYDFTLNCSMDQKPCANTWRFDYFKV